MKIHQSAENYLETILMLTRRNGSCRSIDIANELGFSKPSVSVAMKNLRENGYIEGGIATFNNQYAVCEEDWNQQASKSDGSAGMVRYMRYANTNPKKYIFKAPIPMSIICKSSEKTLNQNLGNTMTKSQANMV